MSTKIKVGIVGYGNIGRGAEQAINRAPDMDLVAVFTRRDPDSVSIHTSGAEVCDVSAAADYKGKIDVMVLCGGSATDLPEQGPQFAGQFNVVDSFDTHARIPEYYEVINRAAKNAGKIGIISVGWDPGLFSMMRMIAGAVLPEGTDYTFWGKGVSQGHSDAIRRVDGVKMGVQYTIPIQSALQKVRDGLNPELSTRDKHLRECFVVPEDGADCSRIEKTIKTMPNYFADYDTVVNFITEEIYRQNHSEMPHGGFVFRTGFTGEKMDSRQVIEFSLNLQSNPEFTANVLIAYARAAVRMNREGGAGARTVFDIPLSYLSPKSDTTLRKDLL